MGKTCKIQIITFTKETWKPFWTFRIQLHMYVTSQTSLANTQESSNVACKEKSLQDQAISSICCLKQRRAPWVLFYLCYIRDCSVTRHPEATAPSSKCWREVSQTRACLPVNFLLHQELQYWLWIFLLKYHRANHTFHLTSFTKARWHCKAHSSGNGWYLNN